MLNIQARCKHDHTSFRTIDVDMCLARARIIARDHERVGEFVRIVDVRNDNAVLYQTAL